MLKTANSSDIKPIPKFSCEKCDFKCSKQNEYNRHLITRKHMKANNANICVSLPLMCPFCSHIFKHASSLSRHKKKCIKPEPPKKHKLYEKEDIVDVLMKENSDFKNIILDLVKSNTDLQKQMFEVCKNSGIHSNTINSHNKTFNMQVFLNEQCKDAMNLMDFVNSMTL